MGDKGKLVKARQELEDLYLGVPDESVNLTFSDFVGVQQNGVAERKITTIGTIHENPSIGMKEGSTLGKSPSIDFVKGMQATTRNHHIIEGGHASPNNSKRNKGLRNPLESSFMYDDVSVMSTISNSTYEERGRRRPGIPHTNICTICSIYIYIFRHRCLVCGRVYCRQCVAIGMGEMTEGRKCIECLGRRFSQRYIQRAGETSCCMRMPSRVKQQELKWAEKGPRGSGERRYGRSGVVSQSRSPVMPRTPRSPVMPRTPTRAHAVSSPPSFVMSSTFSPTHPLPF